jgi:hypothetical protein
LIVLCFLDLSLAPLLGLRFGLEVDLWRLDLRLLDLWLLLNLDFNDLPFVGVAVGDGDAALVIPSFVGVAVGDGDVTLVIPPFVGVAVGDGDGALVGLNDGDGDDEVV